MFPRTQRLLCAICAASLSLAACGQQADQPMPTAPGAKADGDALAARYGALETFDTPQAINVKHLRQLVCAAIADKHPWGSVNARNTFRMRCNDASLVSIARTSKWSSKLYKDAAGKPLTMRMAITVTDGAESWEATLQRRFSERVLKLYWEATYEPAVDNDKFIRDLARDLGEYFDYPGGDWDTHLTPVATADVPAALMTTVQTRAQEIAWDMEANSTESPESCSADLSDDEPVAILDGAGQTIGYIFHVWFYYDEPLFDGGGTRLYYNIAGDLITEIDWWG